MNNDCKNHSNRLSSENSPYLLQHADNPVNWYPWSQEPFEKAQKEDKPIFLSIGYSTCHWCHVMEKESFSNEQIAQIMNEHFICIKVDREEHPAIDEMYMNAVLTMTGSSGWPLSVFLTPDAQPFFGGTYFPPEDRYGHPGFPKVLIAAAQVWKNKQDELNSSARQVWKLLTQLNEPSTTETLSSELIQNGISQLKSIFDAAHGGFGPAPKFPQPILLSLLLRNWLRNKDSQSLLMVERTLDRMTTGGLYDHLGGGFHRYSTDRQWLVPHFEKMLYDQALISKAFIEAYQVTGKQDYARIARETLDYVLRDMTDNEGGFYSAEDADSEGKEGTFYLWMPEETKKVLGPDDAAIFNEHYGVTEQGNFEEGTSILHIAKTLESLSAQYKKDRPVIEAILTQSRSELVQVRSQRFRPHRDDKIIAGWNGLMIASLAYSGAVLDDNRYIHAAEKCAEFILSNLLADGRLRRYYREGKHSEFAVLDDYAFLAMGFLDLYEATFETKWLLEAKTLVQQMVALFGDPAGGGFYLTGSDIKSFLVRFKPSYDGAIPCGNSIAAWVLLKLGKLTMEQRFITLAEQLLNTYSSLLAQSPLSLGAMLVALDFRLGPSRRIVVAGDRRCAETERMLNAIHKRFLPYAVLLFHPSGDVGKSIEAIAPFIKNQAAIQGNPTVYICTDYTCSEPITHLGKLKEQLDGFSPPA